MREARRKRDPQPRGPLVVLLAKSKNQLLREGSRERGHRSAEILVIQLSPRRSPGSTPALARKRS
jgi:hypothetical protein